MSLGVGLYGQNGHQIQHLLEDHPRARLVAIVGLDPQRLPPRLREDPRVRRYDSLAELLRDKRVRLVSLCSPRRSDQARDAIACLRAGRAVYAEKPAALTEQDLDRILAVVQATGGFREMAGTAFEQPYLAVRALLRAGTIGSVVQVATQKSYPYHDERPRDDDIDGGLIGSAGIHAFRFVEHVAGQRIADVQVARTCQGNPGAGTLTMAASLTMALESGAVATATVNYLNPPGTGRWGNDELRVFGSTGMVEVTAGGARTRLIVGDEDRGPIDTTEATVDYFDMYLHHLLDGAPMPLPVEDELHPTRIAIRARR
jgi:predicted dehydrogenase